MIYRLVLGNITNKKTMMTLTFNTTEKTVSLTESITHKTHLYFLSDVPTVRIENGYYEVMQKKDGSSALPVLRLPIANTIMVIEK